VPALPVLERLDTAASRLPIHLALSYDEELGALGAPRMVDDLRASIPLPAIAVIGEPTMMRRGDRSYGRLRL